MAAVSVIHIAVAGILEFTKIRDDKAANAILDLRPLAKGIPLPPSVSLAFQHPDSLHSPDFYGMAARYGLMPTFIDNAKNRDTVLLFSESENRDFAGFKSLWISDKKEWQLLVVEK